MDIFYPKKRRIMQLLILAVLTVFFAITPAAQADMVQVGGDRHGWDLSLPSLAETYKDYFMIVVVSTCKQPMAN